MLQSDTDFKPPHAIVRPDIDSPLHPKIHWTHGLLSVCLLVFLAACGSQTGDQAGKPTNTTAINFAVSLKPPDSASAGSSAVVAAPIPPGGIDCAKTQINVVRAQVMDSVGNVIQSADFKCEDHQGTITGVPVATNLHLRLLGLTSANSSPIYFGTSSSFSTEPGVVTDAGTVSLDLIPESWALTGPLLHARQNHTATLMPNGQVLVAGGDTGGQVGNVGPTELYDPKSGAWLIGPVDLGGEPFMLGQKRSSHTATLLSNGDVLLAGGRNTTSNALSSADLVLSTLPTDGLCEFSSTCPTGEMTVGRWDHTATLLKDNRVLVVGGEDLNNDTLKSAEIYDPTTGKWTSGGIPQAARAFHTATLLPNGQVLVAGGASTGSTYLASAELYDPVKKQWTSTGSMSGSRYGHSALLLSDGTVLVAGGHTGIDLLNTAEIYHPDSGTWSKTGSLNTVRMNHLMVSVNDRPLVVGGINGAGCTPQFRSAEFYDPARGIWSPGGTLTTSREGLSATVLSDGQVLVAGGFRTCATVLNSAELGTLTPP
jgi:hypothetical protein